MRTLPRDSCRPSSPDTTIAANFGLDCDPQHNHARAHSLAQAVEQVSAVAERLGTGCRSRLEMVICRRTPTARDLSLKNIAFGLMTDPAKQHLKLGEEKIYSSITMH